MAESEGPPPRLAIRVAHLMNRTPARWRRTTGGYTTAERWVVTFDDGSSCFVKSGAAHLATFLRAEYHLVYSRLDAPFLPKLLAWDDDEVAPMLVLEDLSLAHWPPPWSEHHIPAVLEALEGLQTCASTLADLPDAEQSNLREGWSEVGRNPMPFLALGLCSDEWLQDALPVVQEASDSATLDGDDVLHFDVRSDNVCFVGDRAILIDWNHICRGPRELDVAAWLPSLHSEGGPLPEEVSTLPAPWAALVSGYFAARAGLPPISQAPTVRTVQLSQLRSALPWAQRTLGLPPLDGPNAP